MGWFYYVRTVRYWSSSLLFVSLLDEDVPAPPGKDGSSGFTSARRDSRSDDVSRLPYTWLSSFPIPELTQARASVKGKV